MNVEDLMTREVVTVSEETPLKEVAALLVRHRISGVPVCDAGGGVIGVVSEKDILYKELGREERGGGPLAWFAGPWPVAAALKANARVAADAMTSPALTIPSNRPVSAAARIMIEQDVNRLPVLGRDGTLVGIVTRADLVRAFSRDDDEIRREIEEEVLLHSLWIAPGTLSVQVEGGHVVIAGELGSSTTAEVLPRVIERVPGVVSVRAELTWPEDEPRPQRRLFASSRL